MGDALDSTKNENKWLQTSVSQLVTYLCNLPDIIKRVSSQKEGNKIPPMHTISVENDVHS